MDNQEDKPKKRKKIDLKKLINVRWIVTITILSMCISMTMSYISNEALANVNNVIAFVILLAFILVGIVFDVIGMAATAATEKEFHSMAAKKVKGAKEAVWLTRNAEKVSSFCNDVVGDISGIISGATGAVMVTNLAQALTLRNSIFLSLLITGGIAAMTIGGKAAGKAIGMGYSSEILYGVGKLLSVLPLPLDKRK